MPKDRNVRKESSTDAIFNIVKELQTKHPIDSDRISVVGISAGGSDAWEIANAEPELFTALSFISSSESNFNGLGELKNIPVWVFHNGEDDSANAKALVKELKQAGCNAFFTETGGENSKDSWTEAFGEYELLTWLTTQKRNNPVTISNEPSQIDFKSLFAEYWPQGTFVGCLIICFIAVKRDATRKRKANLLRIDGAISGGVATEGNSATNDDLAAP